MRKSTKGALAAGAAALLLFGGMGTRADWSDDGTVGGTDIASGHLKLVNASCGGWKIGADVFDPTTIKIVPGSEITQICTFEVDAVGHNLKATLSVTAPSFSAANGLTSELTTAATYEDNVTAAAIDTTTQLSDGDVIKATVTVTLPDTVGNTIQDLTATLDSVTVTATQA